MRSFFLQWIIFLLLFVIKAIRAQNLVPNPGFEVYTECPYTSSMPFYENLDSTWYAYASADYFSTCAIGSRGVPYNVYGFQPSINSNCYMGVIAYSTPNYSGGEYLQVKLTNSLIGGQLYYVQYYVNLADISRYAITNMGAMFTDTLFDLYASPISSWSVPQIENPATNMLSDSVNWVAVSGTFIANGGEQYLTLGNFRDESHTMKQYLGGSGSLNLEAYYYIDDVYVGTTPATSIQEEKKEQDIKLYPNPNNGEMTLDCNLQDTENGSLVIYSLTGKIIKLVQLSSGTKSLRINAQELQAGMYLYEVHINGKESKKNKLTIIK